MIHSDILNCLKKYNIVSFDIFDTLLKRDVFMPTDVFRIVEAEYKKTCGEDIDFFNIRIEAENNARKQSKFEEITYDEIYLEIDLPSSKKEILKNLELKIESSVLHFNPDIKRVYDVCVDRGMKIYIVSDMYLPADFLENILNREKILKYEKLYISCDYRAKKRSGNLFRILCKKEKIKSNNIIHIGDSWYADFIGAKRAGIDGVHIKRNQKNSLYMETQNNESDYNIRTFYSFINSRERKYRSRPKQLGYEVLGPLIYAYCVWIYEQYTKISNEIGNSRLWFAARDMFLFSKAYKIIYGQRIYEKAEYIYFQKKPKTCFDAGNRRFYGIRKCICQGNVYFKRYY